MNINFFKPQSWLLIGIPAIFLFGYLLHFEYDLSGKSVITGIFAPVNESIWEHLKLAVYPTFLWYIIGFLLFEDKINSCKWFACCVISAIISIITIITFYYTYTGALGIHSLLLDIFSLFLGIFIGQCLSLYIYNNVNMTKFHCYLFIIIGLLMIVYFTLFTFSPPKLPIFMDSNTKQYGIH